MEIVDKNLGDLVYTPILIGRIKRVYRESATCDVVVEVPQFDSDRNPIEPRKEVLTNVPIYYECDSGSWSAGYVFDCDDFVLVRYSINPLENSHMVIGFTTIPYTCSRYIYYYGNNMYIYGGGVVPENDLTTAYYGLRNFPLTLGGILMEQITVDSYTPWYDSGGYSDYDSGKQWCYEDNQYKWKPAWSYSEYFRYLYSGWTSVLQAQYYYDIPSKGIFAVGSYNRNATKVYNRIISGWRESHYDCDGNVTSLSQSHSDNVEDSLTVTHSYTFSFCGVSYSTTTYIIYYPLLYRFIDNCYYTDDDFINKEFELSDIFVIVLKTQPAQVSFCKL